MERYMHTKPTSGPANNIEKPTRYLTETELADRLSLSVQFLRKRRDRGEPPYAAKFGNRVRYPIAEIERYEAASFKPFMKPQTRLPDDVGSTR